MHREEGMQGSLCHCNDGSYRSCAVEELGVVSVGNELSMEWKRMWTLEGLV